MNTPARRPRIALVALTQETRDAIGAAAVLATPLPFRVGRESRSAARGGGSTLSRELRELMTPPTNELYLRELSEELNVSREHFQIEWTDDRLILRDRGSTCGTIVEGEQVGGDGESGTVTLDDGDVIIVGTAFSPFVFKVRVESGRVSALPGFPSVLP